MLSPTDLNPDTRFPAGVAHCWWGCWCLALACRSRADGLAINPAATLGPRLAHALLPIAGKGASDWGYAWVPIVGPLAGGAAALWLIAFLGDIMKYILALDQGRPVRALCSLTKPRRLSLLAQKEFPQIFPGQAGLNMTQTTFGRRRAGVAAEAWPTPVSRPGILRPSASPTSARPRSCGIATPANRSATPSSGRTGAPPPSAIDCKADGHDRTDPAERPAWSSTPISPPPSAWILENVPGARERPNAASSRLAPSIPGWFGISPAARAAHHRSQRNASRTMLFNIHTGDWDDELLKFLAFRARCCPKCARPAKSTARRSSSARAIPSRASPATNKPRFRPGLHEPGMVKNTYGTGCFMLMNTGTTDRFAQQFAHHRRLEDRRRTEYALEGSIFIAGAVVQWLRDGLGIIRPPTKSNRSPPGPGQRRRLLRARPSRTGRAALGPIRARCHRRPHPRLHRVSHRPRRPRKHRLPGQRRPRKPWNRMPG